MLGLISSVDTRFSIDFLSYPELRDKCHEVQHQQSATTESFIKSLILSVFKIIGDSNYKCLLCKLLKNKM